MAATAYQMYNRAKRKMAAGTINLTAGIPKQALFTSASNASTKTLSILSQVTNQVANGNGYTTGGKTLSGVAWTTGASAGQIKFDSNDPLWTATGGNIANIKFAVVHFSAGAASGHLLCWTRLSTAQFTVSQGNTLTVRQPSAGLFTLA